MRRRAYLTGGGLSLSIALAGCLGSPRSEPAGSSGTEPEFEVTDLSVSVSIDRPSVAYVLERSASFSGDAVERKADRTGREQTVADISAFDDTDVRDALETAIETGEWRSNTLPDGLASVVADVDFITGVTTGTYTHIGLTLHRLDPDRPPALDFDATLVEPFVAPGQPGVVELELQNSGDSTQEVFAGTVPPFGMVFASALEDDEEFLLWREYEEEGCFTATAGGWQRCDIGTITPIEPGHTVARQYEVCSSATSRYPAFTVPPGRGRYRIEDELSYSDGAGAPQRDLSFESEFRLEPP